MAEKSKSAVIAGIVLGVLFLVAALIQNAWWIPLVLPLLCGALAAYLAGRKSPITAGEGAKFGAVAGVVGGLILVAVGAPLVYFVVRSSVDIEAQIRQSGLNLPGGGLSVLIIYTLIYAGVGVLLAAIGGFIAAPIFGKR
jgi:hypothetical protein